MYIDEDERRDERIRENRNSIITIHILLAVVIACTITAIGVTHIKYDHNIIECEDRLYKHLTQKG